MIQKKFSNTFHLFQGVHDKYSSLSQVMASWQGYSVEQTADCLVIRDTWCSCDITVIGLLLCVGVSHCLALQWCQMSVKPSQFTCLLNVCSVVHPRNTPWESCGLPPRTRVVCSGNIKALYHCMALCVGNPLGTGGFPTQRASNTESVSMSWHRHVVFYG